MLIETDSQTVTLEPLTDRIVIQPLLAQEVSKGGIYLPEPSREKPQQAKVVAAGPGRTENGVLVPNSIVAGDIILYGKYSGTEISIEGEKYIVMRESEVLAIIRTSSK